MTRALPPLPDDLIETVRRLERLILHNTIITGDARELIEQIPDESIDLIFTDPPYSKQWLYLYEWLGEAAARVLKSSGFLISYVPPYYKNIIMGYFDRHLSYFWDYIEYNTLNSTIIWPRKTISRYKSLLCYRRLGSNALPRTTALGVYVGNGGDKRYHKWGQSEQTARYFIDVFSKVDDVVLDPMVGAGTTSFVCKMLGRNYIAFEIDADTADLARARVGGTILPHEEKQLDLI